MVALCADPIDGFWGICEAPIARRENRPFPKCWTSVPDLTFGTAPRVRLVPDELPPWRSAAWAQLEESLRRAYLLGREGADWYRTRVIHPDDAGLVDAAIVVWNGELPDAPEECLPQARKFDFEGRSWWVLIMRGPLTHDEVRALVLAQRR